ncbi:MAG: phosphoserine transaminase [Alphaproteobacteria bacterium]
MKPMTRPRTAHFSSGPCAKRPGWTPAVLSDAALGRSHRSPAGKAKLAEVIERSRRVLGVPRDYRIAIVPASDTGAVEMALWSLLGARGVDVLAWESFGKGWAADVTKELKLADVRLIEAPYGKLPDLAAVDFRRDVVFTWNGTTSGVRVPDGSWIAAGREGLTICDATSAAFAMALPWDRLDVVTYSWQKVLGGEGQHGMLILSPRAAARLESYSPPWPLPKIFRLAKDGKLAEAVFKGETINTPSMLCVEDALDGLAWAERIGGLPALIERSEANLAAIAAWVDRTPWIAFLAADARIRSSTSVCLAFADPAIARLPAEVLAAFAKKLAQLLADEGVAYDIEAYRDAPPGLRIWAGATIEEGDLEALFPWLDWAFASLREEFVAGSEPMPNPTASFETAAARPPQDDGPTKILMVRSGA